MLVELSKDEIDTIVGWGLAVEGEWGQDVIDKELCERLGALLHKKEE
jgi:hypothetical protein